MKESAQKDYRKLPRKNASMTESDKRQVRAYMTMIRMRMKENGQGVTKVAQLAGMSRQSVGQILMGKTSPHLHLVLRICAVVNIPFYINTNPHE